MTDSSGSLTQLTDEAKTDRGMTIQRTAWARLQTPLLAHMDLFNILPLSPCVRYTK
jgi:hypothetical protein